MRDFLNIGSAPYEEDCAQLGTEDYYEKSKDECRRFIDLIRQKCGPEPVGARLATKSFQHDFGTYYEVVCYFDDTIPESEEYAFEVEANAPATWDDNQPKVKNDSE
jgi:hypothetical protein